MARYVISGDASDPSYTLCERLGDIMQTVLSHVEITKNCIHPNEWNDFLAETRRLYGFTNHTASTLVWTDYGKYVGDVTDFTYYCQDVYGINIDLSDADVTAITKENLESATIEYNRKIQRKSPPKNRALIIVGVQNDLCEDGVKAYPKSIETILKINEIRESVAWDMIVRVNLSLPLDHGSTTPHCVSGSLGSNNHPYLKTGPSDVIVYSRSGAGLNETPVDGILKRASIDTAYICGIPSEFTSLAATTLKKGGITTALIQDATCGGESLKQLQGVDLVSKSSLVW